MRTARAAVLRRLIAAFWPMLLLAAVLPLAVLAPLLGAARLWGTLLWGAAAAAAAAGLVRRRRAEPRAAGPDLGLLLLAAAAAHLFAASVGGEPLLWTPLYGAVVVAAAVRFPRWWSAAGAWAAAAALELPAAGLARRLAAGGPPMVTPPPSWEAVASALLALAALAAAAAAVLSRERRTRAALERALEEHRRVRDGAEEYGALAGHRRTPTAEDLRPSEREARTLSARVKLDRDLDRLLDLGRRSVGARGLFLFLAAADAESLRLRGAAGPGEVPPVDRGAVVRPGEGALGRAAQTRRPALFSTIDPGSVGTRFWADGTAPSALLVVPVHEAEVFCGVLAAEGAAADAFGAEQERLLERFAAGIGELLRSHRADLHRVWSAIGIETLVAISKELSSTMVLQELLEKMVDDTSKIVPCDRCAYYSVDPGAPRLLLRVARGFDVPEDREVALPFGRGPAGMIALRRDGILFTNLRARRRSVEIVPGVAGQERIAAIVGVPLVHRDRLVGVWVLASETAGSFAAYHLDILKLVASEAAVLITNAELHEKVERMAVTDGLTGLYNHRHFQERLGHELDRAARGGGPVSLVLMDIDHFKRINDGHGHPFGDEVLRTLARELGRLARRVDLVARYGGEEFAVVLVDTDLRGCARTAERILRTVRAIRIPREGGAFQFTASLGTATWPGDGAEREELVAAADRALYAAKHGGRDCVVAHHEIVPAPAGPARTG